jgi:Protein of unknown function (DUF2652)/Polyketide cyclase / dehydrase and lipid transport
VRDVKDARCVSPLSRDSPSTAGKLEYIPVRMIEAMRAPELTAAEHGSLVLTDISGYTTYLLGTELEHAQDVLADLMGVVVSNLQPPLRVSKLEGDAIFSYAVDGTCGASTLLDTIERSYFAFRERQRDIAHATSCTCAACGQIPTLDLKFIVHHGTFVRREVAGNEELTGRDVIVLHRLAKNSAADALGTKGYVLLTEDALQALGLDGDSLGLQPHAETYEDVGAVTAFLEDLGARWEDERRRNVVYAPADEASFTLSRTVPVEVPVAWDWLTDPSRRAEWNADEVVRLTPGGRERAGVTNHCMHGPDTLVERILDWKPFDYFTKAYDLPVVGEVYITTELTPGEGTTTIDFRGEPLSGDRLAALEQVRPELMPQFERTADAYVERLERVARDARTADSTAS